MALAKVSIEYLGFSKFCQFLLTIHSKFWYNGHTTYVNVKDNCDIISAYCQ